MNHQTGGLGGRVVAFPRKQTVWTSQWHGRRFAIVANVPLPLLPLSFPSLPLEVGPLIAGRASGVRFSSPRGSGRSPAAKRYLVNLASGSNNLQELFRKWTGGTRWPSGNILVQTNCLDITMACMEDVLQGCGDACGSFCTAYYFFAWALGEAVVPPSSPSLNWRPWVTLVSWVCYS